MRCSALPSLSRRCYLRKPKTLPELRTPTHPNTASIRSSALLVGASTTKLINSVTTGTHTVASKNARQANITPRAQHFGLGYFKRLPPPLWPRAGTRTPELTRLRPHKARAPTTHRGGSNGGYRGHSDYGKQQPAPASIQAFCLNCLHQHGGTRISPAYTASRLPLKRATAPRQTPAVSPTRASLAPSALIETNDPTVRYPSCVRGQISRGTFGLGLGLGLP